MRNAINTDMPIIKANLRRDGSGGLSAGPSIDLFSQEKEVG
jgi:hypothetical protein